MQNSKYGQSPEEIYDQVECVQAAFRWETRNGGRVPGCSVENVVAVSVVVFDPPRPSAMCFNDVSGDRRLLDAWRNNATIVCDCGERGEIRRWYVLAGHCGCHDLRRGSIHGQTREGDVQCDSHVGGNRPFWLDVHCGVISVG